MTQILKISRTITVAVIPRAMPGTLPGVAAVESVGATVEGAAVSRERVVDGSGADGSGVGVLEGSEVRIGIANAVPVAAMAVSLADAVL